MKIISEHRGHLVKEGVTAGSYSNPYKICDDGKGYIVEMFDSKGRSFFFDYADLKKVLLFKTDKGNRVSWYVTKTGVTSDGTRDLRYVGCRNGGKMIYLHRYLMSYTEKKGKGKYSIDHKNRNPLDNTINNLREATQSEQNKNTGKRSRKITARPLPEGITQNMLPKYVVYYYENQKNQLGYRDYFVIESHPVQVDGRFPNKWATSKSMKVSIIDKLNTAIEQLKKLDKLVETNN